MKRHQTESRRARRATTAHECSFAAADAAAVASSLRKAALAGGQVVQGSDYLTRLAPKEQLEQFKIL